ncbi:hypothetical protein ANN_19657, partial [Periplaneta americana]
MAGLGEAGNEPAGSLKAISVFDYFRAHASIAFGPHLDGGGGGGRRVEDGRPDASWRSALILMVKTRGSIDLERSTEFALTL